MSLVARCTRLMRPAGIQLRSLSILDIHQGTGDRNGELIRAQVKEYNGYVYVDVRRFFIPEGSTDFAPTKKGISLTIEQFENLAESIAQIKQMIKDEQS